MHVTHGFTNAKWTRMIKTVMSTAPPAFIQSEFRVVVARSDGSRLSIDVRTIRPCARKRVRKGEFRICFLKRGSELRVSDSLSANGTRKTEFQVSLPEGGSEPWISGSVLEKGIRNWKREPEMEMSG